MCFFIKINLKFNFQFFLSEKNLGTFLNILLVLSQQKTVRENKKVTKYTREITRHLH